MILITATLPPDAQSVCRLSCELPDPGDERGKKLYADFYALAVDLGATGFTRRIV